MAIDFQSVVPILRIFDIAKADEFQLILRRDNGDDLIFVSHQYHERREHIGGRVWAGRLIR